MGSKERTRSGQALAPVAEHFRAEAAEVGDSLGVPGYLAGVYHDGEQTVIAHGSANVATGAPMTEDTGFLTGSITKVLTTTLLLRYVERGEVDLDERVTKYLPEFALAAPARPEELRVRNLVNHTDGIDGDMYLPDGVKGRDALKDYVERLQRCSTLFEPGEFVSYSNPAFMVAGRLLEVVTGESYHALLEREIYGSVGMLDSSTSAEQAILRRTAVGHFLDPETKAARRTDLFMLPESWSACGGTPIVTIADLLAFARTHLADGLAPTGKRVLSSELTQQMQTVTHDMGTPNVPPIGLGWWLFPFGETTALWHGGGSPGGTAALLLVPEHDLAFAAFGNMPGAAALHDRLFVWLLREHLGLDVPATVTATVELPELTRYEGTYRSDQIRVDLTAIDGRLEQVTTFEPLDADHARILGQFSGGQLPPPPQRLVPVGDGLFAPADTPLESFTGQGRLNLVSFHGQTNGGPAYSSSRLRLPRRQPSSV